MKTPRILIVAGSDSGGGAGIQADIKTVTMLGGHAMTAITAITAQNTLGVQAVHPVPTDIVVAQMRSCLDDIGVDAVKIGMIGSAETAHAVADVLEGLVNECHPGEGRGPVPMVNESMGSAIDHEPARLGPGLRRGGDERAIPIVFDPVMVATSGAILADAAAIAAFERLMRIATVITPNLPEARELGGIDAIRAHGCHVLFKGGHGEGDTIVDRLIAPDGTEQSWESRRITTSSSHGTGCTLASAIAVGLAEGMWLIDSVERAIAFVRASLERAPGLGAGHGPMGQQFVTDFR